MKKPRPSAPDERGRIDGDDATPIEPGGRDDPPRPSPAVDPEEMGGEAPCHLPRFWDVDE